MPDWRTYFPPVGGFRFGMFTVPPGVAGGELADLDAEAALADLDTKLPGMMRYMDPSDPGMHTTDTIDFEVVLEGTIVLELDDGAEVTLHPGDTVVQNGTRHRWRNPGDNPRPARPVHLRCRPLRGGAAQVLIRCFGDSVIALGLNVFQFLDWFICGAAHSAVAAG